MLRRSKPELPADGRVMPPPGRRLRIGVLTFHRCINYGSYWQARCLLRGLRALGHEAVLLDHHDARIARRELVCALQPLLPRRSDRVDRLRYAAKVRAFAAAQARLPLSPRFALGEGPGRQPFDAILIGSDEVWNPSHPWYGGAGLFWGEGLAGTPLLAYAASVGSHAMNLPADRAATLGRFRAIAVRDRTTQTHVQAITGKAPPLVLDPCLQFPPEPAAPLRRAPYALVYGHDFPDWAGPAIRAWAARHELHLLSIGYRNGFADAQWLEAGPGGFASAVAGAAAVITTMFHGSVFALNGRKRLAAIPSDYRAAKLTDLTTLLRARRHLVHGPEALNEALSAPPEAAVHAGIAALRAASHDSLRHALA